MQESRADHALKRLFSQRWALIVAVLAFACVVTASWIVRLALAPARHASEFVSLDAHGIPGVELKVIHPTRLGEDQIGRDAEIITVTARASDGEPVAPFDLVLLLPDEAVAFTDRDGGHVPGRLRITPGFPDAIPHDLFVAHGNTSNRSGFLGSDHVDISAILHVGGTTKPVPELGFRIRLESRWERATRLFVTAVSSVAMPYLLLGVISGLGLWTWQQYRAASRRRAERSLAVLHARLREEIKLERWPTARQTIECIQLERPQYRDVERLDTLVSSAETAAWRRQQLYETGVLAYTSGDWPRAIQAFAAIETESPYYRDVRFLTRTATLYTDLCSRDRSLRVRAAGELGMIADLVDMLPLLLALGDHASEVADAAEASFNRIGLQAFDALLGGLGHEMPSIRERAYRIVKGQGQAARGELQTGLHSPDPRTTEPVAQLLAEIGAFEDLANALIWIAPEHHEGIVSALAGAGAVAANALLATLIAAPPERQQAVINAVCTLKSHAQIDRRIEALLHSTKEPSSRALLRRVLDAPASGFGATDSTPALLDTEPVAPQAQDRGRKPRPWRSRLLDRRRS